MAKLAFALGCASVVLIALGLTLSNEAGGLGGLVVAFWWSIPTVMVAAAGIVVAILARRRRAGPRWMTVVGLVLDGLALLPGLYILVGFIAVWISFSIPGVGF